MLCSFGVLICATICCSNVVPAPDDDTKTVDDVTSATTTDNSDVRTCIADYLQKKDKLSDSTPSEEPSQFCRFTMTMVIRLVTEKLKTMLTTLLPKDMSQDCFTTEYDKTRTVDTIFTISTVKTKAEMDAVLAGPMNELKDQLKGITSKCGVTNDDFELAFSNIVEAYKEAFAPKTSFAETVSETDSVIARLG